MMSDSKDSRATPRLKASIPCKVHLVAPEETFSPHRYEGSILDISQVGIGLFGTFTAYIASLFLSAENEAEFKREEAILRELKEIRKKLEK